MHMQSELFHQIYQRTRWSLLLRGLVWLALGIFILARPLESVAALALVIAIWALVSGISQIVQSIEMRAAVAHWWLMLVSGIISVGFGIAAFRYYPGLSLAFAVIWTAYWFLLSGAVAVSISMQERRIGMPWGWTAFFGVVSVIAGIYAIFLPPATLAVIMSLLAALAIVGGCAQLFGAYALGKVQAAPVAGVQAPAPR
jgi:uncharacterized membrane protein HdeD (DUF308 family)